MLASWKDIEIMAKKKHTKLSDGDKAWFDYIEGLFWRRFDYVNEADKQLTAKFSVLLAAVVALASQFPQIEKGNGESSFWSPPLIHCVGLVLAALTSLWGFNAGDSNPGPNVEYMSKCYRRYGLVPEARDSIGIGLRRAIEDNEARQKKRAALFNLALYILISFVLISHVLNFCLDLRQENSPRVERRGDVKLPDRETGNALQRSAQVPSSSHQCCGATPQPPPADPGPREVVQKGGSGR